MASYQNSNGDFLQPKQNDEALDFFFADDAIMRNEVEGQLPQSVPQFSNENFFSSEYSYKDKDMGEKPYNNEFLLHNEEFSHFINPNNISNPYISAQNGTNKNSQSQIELDTDSKGTSRKENSGTYVDDQLLNEEDRKKKINRDAQRAFRRRKEEKLKEMEQKWMNSENDKKELLQQIEKLKKVTYEMSLENKELHKKSLISGSEYDNNTSTASSISHNSPIYNFPNKTEYVQYIYSGSAHDGNLAQLKDISYQTDDGEAMTVSKTWEYLFKKLQEKEQEGYTFDSWKVMCLMKGHEVCHGSGAAYLKSFVDSVVDANLEEL